MAYTKNIDNVENYHVSDFLSVMSEKEVAHSAINNAKYAVVAILHIRTYPSINKHPLIMHVIGISNLRPPKQKRSNILDMDVLFRYLETTQTKVM